jgi:hypothetical protein
MHQRRTNTGSANGSNNSQSTMYSRAGGAGGYGRDVEGGGRFNDTNANIMEQQNNERIYELSEQVARLKVIHVIVASPNACIRPWFQRLTCDPDCLRLVMSRALPSISEMRCGSRIPFWIKWETVSSQREICFKGAWQESEPCWSPPLGSTCAIWFFLLSLLSSSYIG